MTTILLSLLAIMAALFLGAFVLLHKQQRSLSSAFLAVGLFLMALLEVADLLALNRPDIWSAAKSAAAICESLLGLAWLLFALTFARQGAFQGLSRRMWLLLGAALCLPLLALVTPPGDFYYSPDFVDEHILFLGRSSYWFYLGLLFFSVAALYRLERTLLAFTSVDRHLVVHEIIGVGMILVAMLAYYSQAMLYRTIDMNLLPIRSLALLIGSGLCGYSRLRRWSGQGLLVSRDVASRSVVVLAVGCYLLLLGGAGESLRYFGLHNQRTLLVGFAILTGLVFVLLLLSEKNRRKLNVLLNKHFYRHKYDYRNEWLLFTAQLSAAENMDKLQAAIMAFFCETFGRTGAALYLRDGESGSYQQKDNRYLDFPQRCFLPNHPLIEYFNETDWVFNSDDQHAGPFDDILPQFAEAGVTLCVPLQYEQHLEGFLLLGDAVNPDEALNFEDFDLMKVLARQATSVLLSLKLSAQLSTAQEMAAIGRVSTFVLHDLKNHVSNLTLMVDNAREHMADPEFQADMLETLQESIGKMNGLIRRLKNFKGKSALQLRPCDLGQVVGKAAKSCGLPPDAVKVEQSMALIDAEEIEKVAQNLILNAREAGSLNGTVALRVGCRELAFFEVSDRGCGMSEEFLRSRLFQPFQTTKEKGLGIGLYQCRQIVEAHGGRIEVQSKPGEGSVFTVYLPRA